MSQLLVQLGVTDRPDVGEAVSEFAERAAQEQPKLDEDLSKALAELGLQWAEIDDWASLQAGDLYLVGCVLLGNKGAMHEFDRVLVSAARRALSRLNGLEAMDDLLQDVRARLLLPKPDKGPQLASYQGKGPLINWLGVVVSRAYLNVVRRREPEIPSDEDSLYAKVPSPLADPELAHMRDKYEAAFKEAFHKSIEAMSAKDKNLLRHFYIDGLNLDALARRFQTSRASAHRWLIRARVSMAEGAEALLKEELAIQGDELRSIRRVLHSDLDLSLVRALQA